MRIVRTIMAVLLAVAVAAAPAAGGAMSAAGTARGAATAHAAAMPVDCPHHQAPADSGSKGTDIAALGACAVHCFTYAGTVVPSIAIVLKFSQLPPPVAEGHVASNLAAPPFRPPRV